MNDLDQYYKTLELEPGASLEQVKQAYRDLARVWHPDRFSHDPRLQQKAQEKLKEINNAYEQLRSVLPGSYTKHSQPKSKYQRPKAEPESTSTKKQQSPPEQPQPTNTPLKRARDWRALILLVILAGGVLLIVLFRQFNHSEKTSMPRNENSNRRKAEVNTPVSTTEPSVNSSSGSEFRTDVNASTSLDTISKLITNEADLIKIYGRQNVQSKSIHIGEGEFEPGTVIFIEEPTKTAAIIWEDSNRKHHPQSFRISGQKSVWKVGPGITLGTTLKELEQLNGRPFLLAGFGWDYSGTVVSWEKGNLEKQFTTNGRVILRCRPIEEIYKMVSSQEAESVLGDQDFRSDNKVMQKINPRVYEIIIERK